ncbi:hypothetical protein PL373_09265 [Tenacibaculum maritimum]|nr:hypothetical protein [Tenacibaculum maritimum]MDB0601333.1 hypothetical protein [Tenacibaculum maritimum]MDB0611754.1 hypothetical protein [Tenacibaculum maritimum]
MTKTFLFENGIMILQMIGAVFIFLLGRKSRKVKDKEAEFLAYEKKLENYKLEFDIKSQMLENLKNDYDDRGAFLEKNLDKVKAINKELSAIITDNKKVITRQSKVIDTLNEINLKYEQKFGTLETN